RSRRTDGPQGTDAPRPPAKTSQGDGPAGWGRRCRAIVARQPYCSPTGAELKGAGIEGLDLGDLMLTLTSASRQITDEEAAMVSRIIPVDDFDLVIFGATGDLARRKIVPGLYRRFVAGQVPVSARIIGAARTRQDDDAFRAEMRAAIEEFAGPGQDAAQIAAFLDMLGYVAIDARGTDGWAELKARMRPGVVHAFYFSVAPGLFGDIAERLAGNGIADADSCIGVEKPFGRDLETARQLNATLARQFTENQISRTDHYLGKETDENQMAVCYGNNLFEPLWNAQYVDHVQITVAETVGVGGRGEYYDHSGAIRDMVQNHLMQLLCLIAMEPPYHFDPDAVRDEKLKVIRALEPVLPEDIVR